MKGKQMKRKLFIAGLTVLTLTAQAVQGPELMGFQEQMEYAMALSSHDQYVPQQDHFEDEMLVAIAASLQNVEKQDVDEEYNEAIALSKREYLDKKEEESDIHCLNDELFHLIEEKGSVQEVLKLVNKEANINVRYSGGLTPLMVAARENRPVICSLLIAKGAKINTEDNEGNTPLDFAIGTNNSRLCKLFVAQGANLNPVSDSTDVTLLGRTMLRKCDHDLYKYLSENGAKL